MLKDNQGKMVKSLLNKLFRKIQINKLFIERNNACELITEPTQVQLIVKEHFEKQFKKRNTQLQSLPQEWKQIYKPKEEIEKSCFQEVEYEIELEEWMQTVKEMKSTSAPGPSGIGYILIQRANISTHRLLVQFTNMCIIEAKIPLKWKIVRRAANHQKRQM
jgi:hypothetical protein